MLTIERLLGVMSVERLILPAAKGKESLWIDKFGFTQMNDLQVRLLYYYYYYYYYPCTSF
jgi:hypothetical protein